MNTRPARRTRRALATLGLLAATVGLTACGGGSDVETVGAEPATATSDTAQILSSRKDRSGSDGASTASGTAIAQPANIEGRLLASNCFQCHGTLGLGGFDKIRGDESKEVLEFAAKAADRDIMAAHAQGYTPEQLRKIIAYLQQ